MNLVGYVKNNTAAPDLPPCEGGLFDYVLTTGGIYVHARRDALEVSFPIAVCHLRGVEPSEPVFTYELPRVPLRLIQQALVEASVYAQDGLETLFHFEHSALNPFDDGWLMHVPRQERSAAACRPLDEGEGSSHHRAIIELHSHHSMTARFSSQDDRDETGFRIYGVMGRLHEKPEIRFRVGVYGYFWEIPASWVVDLPEHVTDCNEVGRIYEPSLRF